MKIICAGAGKTGTKSIAKALRHLGFTVFDWEEQMFDFLDHWVDVFQNGTKPDVKRVYQNADVCVDSPGNFFFEEILKAFPDCKVILSVREEDSWIESAVRHLELIGTLRSDNGDGNGNVRSLGRAGLRPVAVPAKIEITNFTSENVDDGH